VRVGLNHVTVQVDELEASIRFYEEMFGLERLVAPSFGVPVAWLRVGDLQVHLNERPGPPSGHFALNVSDVGAVYRRAVENGSLARDAQGHAVYVLPSGEIQLYVLDPSDNVVEVNHHDAERWREEIPEMVALADLVPQSPDAATATLFLDSRT
jgi:catechol 2,3-dioxygenase-like lactoylglutathione lyase family enzyme